MRSWTRKTLFVSLALAVGACARIEPPPMPVARVIPSEDFDTLAQIMRLEDRRDFDGRRFEAWLASPSPLVRRYATIGVARIAPRGGALLVVPRLDDADAGVRVAAAFALGELADTAADVLTALGAAGARADDPAMAAEAAASLGKLGGAMARAALVDMLATSTAEPVLAEGLLASARLPADQPLLEVVRRQLTSPSAELRWRAAYALFRLAAPAAALDLVSALADAHPLVRAMAARGLRAPYVDSVGLRQQALPALRNALADPETHVRINAARVIGAYADSTSVPLLVPLLTGDDAGLAIVAAQALGEIGAPARGPLDAIAADASRRPALRAAAATALLRFDAEAGVRRIDELLSSGAWLDQFHGARALANAPWPFVLRRARRLFLFDDGRLAAAGVQAVAQAAPDTAAAAYAFFIEALAHRDFGARAAALEGLARRGDPADLPVLLAAYDRAQHDGSQNDAALAAVDALGALAAKGTPVARSFFLRFPRSSDPLVRAQVAARLGQGSWGDAHPIDEPRDSAFYGAVVRSLVEPELRSGMRPRVRLTTTAGTLTLELNPAQAPLTVYNFVSLASRGFFVNTRWHRVVPNFVVQDGDPRGDGSGGPGYAIRDEINPARYGRGVLGMALSGPDTGGSQFFITHSPQPHLDGVYTVFGRVVDGIDVLDRIVQDDAILSIEVIS